MNSARASVEFTTHPKAFFLMVSSVTRAVMSIFPLLTELSYEGRRQISLMICLTPQNRFYLQTDLSLRRSDWDWARTIEIIELIESRVSGYVEGWNFNRHGQKNGTLRVH